VVAAVRDERGDALPGSEGSGFEVDATRDRQLTVVLRELPDDEL
jgi:hypothetical protein